MSYRYESSKGFHSKAGPLTNAEPFSPPNQGKPFEPWEYDLFLDMFLEKDGRTSKSRIAKILGRNEKSMQMLEWELPTKYVVYKTAGQRQNRTGKVWHARDQNILKLGRNDEAKSRGVDTAYIALVLGRLVQDVLDHEAGVAVKRGGGFGLAANKFNPYPGKSY